MSVGVTDKYLNFNTLKSKDVSVVVSIPGLPYLTNRTIYTRIRYGDPDINYGAGYIYGGLRKRTDFLDYLSLEGSSLTISQRLEPEQGRAAVSTLTLAFIDKNQYMSKVVAPGSLIDDIMGSPVTVYLGFEQISFPEDYFVIFRGVITQVTAMSGTITLQTSDQNVTRRQNIFYTPKSTLVNSIDSVQTTIKVTAPGDINKAILSPASTGNTPTYDSALRFFLKVDNEYIEYGPSATVPTGTFDQTTGIMTNVVRNSPPTNITASGAATHASGTGIAPALQIQDRATTMALKLMLSGWGGVWQTGVAISSIVATLDLVLGDQAKAIILPPMVDPVILYGLTLGDFATISGATNGANNVTCKIVGFGDLAGDANRIIYTDQPLVRETNSPATLSFRSQYDTYPTSCGVKLTPNDVDVDRHNFIENTFLAIYPGYRYRFIITDQQNCKTFIENEIYLPVGLYSLTRQGKLSVGLTKPPLADENLQFLTQDNVKDPKNITVTRATNNRKFFNIVTYEYDADDQGNFASSSKSIDTDSVSIIKIPVELPIKSIGAKTDLGFPDIISRNVRFLLSRYKRGAQLIDLTTNWEIGSQIEAGDVVALVDNGTLQISDFSTGKRDAGAQLYEVINRDLDIASGETSLELVTGVGANLTDRFAVISPSSIVADSPSSTANAVYIKDSYGPLYPGNEQKKWTHYIGQKIIVHSPDYTVSAITTLLSFNPQNRYQMNVSTLPFTPQPGYVVDINDYPNDVDPTDAMIYKSIFAFLDPEVTVVSGVSTSQLTVSGGDIGKFHVNCIVRIHDPTYDVRDSGDVVVSAIDTGTNTLTLSAALSFTPQANDLIELIGFPDFGTNTGGAYRWI